MTEVRGGHVIDVLKGAGKMRGAIEPAFFGDGLNGVGRGLQQVFGLTQAVLQDIFMRGAAEIFLNVRIKWEGLSKERLASASSSSGSA